MAELYYYRVRDKTGNVITGFLEVLDEDSAIDNLRANDYYIIDLYPARDRKNKKFSSLNIKRVKSKDLAVYCNQFATMISAGIPIVSCLWVLEKQTSNSYLAEASGELAKHLQGGHTFAGAVYQYPDIFPAIFGNVIEAGEHSGKLELSLKRLALHFEREHRIKEKIKSAITYPIIVVIISMLVVFILISFVLPAFTDMLLQYDLELPLPTRIVVSASGLMATYWFLVMIILFLLVFMMRYYLKSDEGKEMFDRLILQLPVLGNIILKMIISRFSHTLSTLLGSGVSITQSFSIIKKVVKNSVVAGAITEVENNIKYGQGLSQTLALNDVFPPMVVQMIKVGEDTGSLDRMLEKIAEYYDQEIDEILNRLTSLLEPFLILIVGGLVAIVIASILLPLFTIFEVLS